MIPAPPQISRAEPPANPQNPRREPRHEAAPLTLPPRLTTAALLAFRRAGGSHDPGRVWRLAAESGAPGQLATAAGRYRGSEPTPVTLAPPVPSHTAWMSQPCCPATWLGPPRRIRGARPGRWPGIAGHRNASGTQKHQKHQEHQGPSGPGAVPRLRLAVVHPRGLVDFTPRVLVGFTPRDSAGAGE